MKWIKWGVVLLLVAAAADVASAHRGHGSGVRFGLSFNYLWGPWYERPVYVPVFVDRAPPIYVERQDLEAESATAPQPGYWYYCAAARRYYPDVAECPAGWHPVPPRPAARP